MFCLSRLIYCMLTILCTHHLLHGKLMRKYTFAVQQGINNVMQPCEETFKLVWRQWLKRHCSLFKQECMGLWVVETIIFGSELLKRLIEALTEIISLLPAQLYFKKCHLFPQHTAHQKLQLSPLILPIYFGTGVSALVFKLPDSPKELNSSLSQNDANCRKVFSAVHSTQHTACQL